jgi:arylsulfatase A-like enzyme
VGGAPSGGAQGEASERPHVLFIVPDDMGWNDIGYQSSDMKHATPTLNALAADGIKLGSYYTQSSCTPARSALLAGYYPSSIGMGMDSQGAFTISSPYGVGLEHTLLPEAMRDAGYETHMVGKWNIGHYAEALLPHMRGFDSFLGYNGDEENYYSHVPFAMAPFSGWNASDW